MVKIKLNSIDTRAPKKFNKEQGKKELQKLKFKLDELQNLFYAEGRQALLIVIQGMDASGKDGAIKNVFEAVNPMGCRVIPFKQPSALESKHDFLWRIHQQVPEKGMICIFNRSHYEDVLVQRVHQWVDAKIIKQRYNQINNLKNSSLKQVPACLSFTCMFPKKNNLNDCRERLSDPSKMWKYNENDIKEREYWGDYMKAYEDAFENCSEYASWNIVPLTRTGLKNIL